MEVCIISWVFGIPRLNAFAWPLFLEEGGSNNFLTETGKAVNLLTKVGITNRSILLVRAPFLRGALVLERALKIDFTHVNCLQMQPADQERM